MNGQLGIPFLPFTFPTTAFCGVAVDMGLFNASWPYPSLWSWADGGWEVYKKIRPQLKDNELGNTDRALKLMQDAGMKYQDAADWLDTADAASNDFWASNTAFRDFKGGGVPVVIRDVAEGVGVTIRSVAGGVLKGITGSGSLLPVLVIGGLVVYGVSQAKKRSA